MSNFYCYKFTNKNKRVLVVFDNLDIDEKRKTFSKYVDKFVPDTSIEHKNLSGLIYYKIRKNIIYIEYIITFLRGKNLFYSLFESLLREKADIYELVNLANFNIYQKLGFHKKNDSLEKIAQKILVENLLSKKMYPKLRCHREINLDDNQMKELTNNVEFLFIIAKTIS
jgi:hypothetical protein